MEKNETLTEKISRLMGVIKDEINDNRILSDRQIEILRCQFKKSFGTKDIVVSNENIDRLIVKSVDRFRKNLLEVI